MGINMIYVVVTFMIYTHLPDIMTFRQPLYTVRTIISKSEQIKHFIGRQQEKNNNFTALL